MNYLNDLCLLHFQSGFDWEQTAVNEYQMNQTIQTYKLTDVEDVSRLRFAVAITTGETTGETTWEEYRYGNLNAGRK